MPPQRPRYYLIERLARRLLDEAGIHGPAVDVRRLAEAQGCSVRVTDLKEVSGALVRSPKGVFIGANARQSAERRSFTIAHELGHLLLHDGHEVWHDQDFRVSLRSDLSSEGTDVEEVEANFFAASLLMPDHFLAQDGRAHVIDLESEKDVRTLAKAYGVSVHAMTLRLARFLGRRTARGVAARTDIREAL